jgi:hypothetical protein
MTLSPYFGLFVDYRFDDGGGGAATTGLVGRVKAGLKLNLGESATVDVGGELGGLGSPQRAGRSMAELVDGSSPPSLT